APFVVRLEVVHVRTRSVHVRSNTMPRSMKEGIPEALLFDVMTSDIIDLVACKGFLFRGLTDRERRRLFSRILHNVKHLLNLVWDGFATKPSPRYVVKHGARFIQL